MNYQTIQKVAKDMGVAASYIRKMIDNGDLTPFKKEGYERIFIDIDELNASIKPINTKNIKIDLDRFQI